MLPTAPSVTRSALLAAAWALVALNTAAARDWIHWRGPEQNGLSREKNLPGMFDPKAGKSGNVLWQQPFGGRSAPLVMDGKVYIIQGVGEGLQEGEQIACFDEASGKPLWQYKVGVFHTDIVSARLGWTTLTADPATKSVYAHTTGGLVLCLDPAGKPVWQRSLTEEYGRITGYGGRVVSPVFDSGLCIVGMTNSNWGDQARPSSRFVAFDGKTGQVVWWADGGFQFRGTYYSSPVIAVINGQRLMITGGADGYLHAFKVRTGERVWSYRISNGVVNGSPVVDGNLVYCGHGEDNPEGGPLGRFVCVDAGKVDPKTKEPKLVWEVKGRRFGLASPALADGLVFAPDDQGTLHCFDAKKGGKALWQYRYAREVRGAPLVADGKLYIFDAQGRLLVLALGKDPREGPDEDETFEFKFRDPRGFLNETNGTPIAVNGRLYFTTRTDLYCVGLPDAKPECGEYRPLAEEAKHAEAGAPTAIRIFPADVTAAPGEAVKFTLVTTDANGRPVKGNLPDPAAQWSLPAPPAPKAADPNAPPPAAPPPLRGKVEGDGAGATLTLDPGPGQQGYVEVDFGGLKARARVRVVPPLPYTADFEKAPAGAPPGGWANAQGKFVIAQRPTGEKVLAKTNTDPRPTTAKANGYITLPSATGYTIQADLMGVMVRNQLPDMGLVNCRYTFVLDGKPGPDGGKRLVRIGSWEGRQRVAVAAEFDWQPDVWYTARFTVEQKEKSAVLRAKVWKKGEPEPDKWTVEFEDPNPNREGAAALYGYISNIPDSGHPGSEIYYDNVTVTPNGAAPAGKK